jgi:membrane protease YdiL (CAAX protease family)
VKLAEPQAVPSAPADGRTLIEEVFVVLALSFLASAAYAILSILEAPIAGVRVASVNQSSQLARQLLGFVFGLAPVYLVWHIVHRTREGLVGIGLDERQPRKDAVSGLAIFVVVALGGIGIYLGAVALGVNRFVVPVPPIGHWWTVPVLLLNAALAALLEEVIVLAYLVTRLRQLALTPWAAIGASALLRGTYHLYQGWGGFAGNLAMGLLFGWLFIRTRRAWPFVIAHFLLDVAAGVGFLLFRDRLPGF